MPQANARPQRAIGALYAALDARGCSPRGTERRFVAHCPSHDDRHPSLAVTDAGDRALLHCFAGCETEAVVATLGLTLADLFDRDVRNTPHPTTRRAPCVPSRRRAQTEADADIVLTALRTIHGPDAYRVLNERSWVAWCPLCGGHRLLVVEDEHDRALEPDSLPGVTVSCMDAGCDSDAVVAALAAGLRGAP